MPKKYRGICEQCGMQYCGRGQRFCSNSCRVRWTNLHRNVAKRQDVRLKISQSRRGKPTTTGRKLPPSQKQHISDSLKGRKITPEIVARKVASWRRNVSVYGGLSPKHRLQLEELHRKQHGENHPFWRGGTTPQRVKEYQTERYLSFVEIVLARDNYTCQKCGMRNGNRTTVRLQVHHVKSYAEYPELRYNVSNGITFCLKCHNMTKKGVPRPINRERPIIARC